MSCLWLGHTCVPTTPLFSHFTKYLGNNSTQNKWRAPEKAECSSPQEKSAGQIQADRHTNFAISSNTSGFVMHAAQRTQRNGTLANQWKIRLPGPTISETPRSFSWCWFEIPIAHFSKRSVQMMPDLIKLKF